jgi:thiamine pyrophosphate-dependent acetolactate synthase large subunit-like protein
MQVADAIAHILKREGIEFIVGYPVNPILEAAAKVDIRPIIVRQERTGLHIADAYSRLNSGNRVGVFAMQNGPGSENAFGGVAQAWGDSSPILVLPGGYARGLMAVQPHFSSYLNYQHITKSAEVVTVAAEAPNAMRRAFAQVLNGRPRPVLVEFPGDVFREEIADDFHYEPVVRTRSAPDPDAVREAARVLLEAERPVIYAGQGVHYAKAWDSLRTLAELLEAPVTTSLEGKSAFPEDHPLSLGSGGRSLPKPVFDFVQGADVIFGVGCSFAATNYGIQFPTGKTVIHATLDPSDIDRTVEAQYALIGDAQLTLDALIEAVRSAIGESGRGRRDAVVAQIEASRSEWLASWAHETDSDEAPLSPYRVIRDLAATVDVANTIITHDAGSPRDQLSPFWKSTTPLSYIGWGKTTQLGYGLGLAMGAKLARPDKLCINVWGDAAIGMTGMDFETAVRARIPIMSVLLNNFSMAIELPVMPASTEKYRSTDISGHYADMAKAFGGYGERVTEPSEIVPAIKRGIEQTKNGTPVLLEFITKKSHDYSVFR